MKVQLVYFDGCPNVERAREVLRRALAACAPFTVSFEEVDVTARGAPAHLARPAGSTHFEVLVNVGPQLIEKLKKVKLEIAIDGLKIGEQEFETPGWRTLKFEAPPSTKATAQVELKSSPGFFYEDHNPADALGIAISGFGFPTPQYPAVLPPVQ